MPSSVATIGVPRGGEDVERVVAPRGAAAHFVEVVVDGARIDAGDRHRSSGRGARRAEWGVGVVAASMPRVAGRRESVRRFAAATADSGGHSAAAPPFGVVPAAIHANPASTAAPAANASLLHFSRTAGIPGVTTFASSLASQFVRRMQPCEVVLPIVDGSGVP